MDTQQRIRLTACAIRLQLDGVTPLPGTIEALEASDGDVLALVGKDTELLLKAIWSTPII